MVSPITTRKDGYNPVVAYEEVTGHDAGSGVAGPTKLEVPDVSHQRGTSC